MEKMNLKEYLMIIVLGVIPVILFAILLAKIASIIKLDSSIMLIIIILISVVFGFPYMKYIFWVIDKLTNNK